MRYLILACLLLPGCRSTEELEFGASLYGAWRQNFGKQDCRPKPPVTRVRSVNVGRGVVQGHGGDYPTSIATPAGR